MKKIVILLSFMLCLIVSLNAENVKNDVQKASCNNRGGGIPADTAALKYKNLFNKAVDLEGEALLVNTTERVMYRSSLFKNKVCIIKEYIYFDKTSNYIKSFKKTDFALTFDTTFLWSLVIIAILIISNLLYLKFKKTEKDILVFFSFCIIILAGFILVFRLFSFLSFISLVAFATTGASMMEMNTKRYTLACVISYAAMLSSVILQYNNYMIILPG